MAYEGLGKWEVALENYNKAVTLWGGQSTTDRDASLKPDIKAYNGVNPYALTFRGNVLNKQVIIFPFSFSFLFNVVNGCILLGKL